MKKNMNSDETKARRKLAHKKRSKSFDKDKYNKERYAKIKAFRDEWGWF
tara:strand:- start:19922 stop:20068 length:147 start_codon:yes stop_codon:yes gene_type:complete